MARLINGVRSTFPGHWATPARIGNVDLTPFILGTVLLFSAALAGAQPKPEAPKPAPEAVTEKPKPAPEKPKAPEPVLEIKRTGPPDCLIEPVMTDAEIAKCRRAVEGRVGK